MERKHNRNSRKKISIIVPTYNRRSCIMRAINSVLNQEKNAFDYEIIISDDGSTDNTKELFKKKTDKIIYFYKPNGGVLVARNRAIKKAKGDFLLFLDSDDWLTPNTLITIENNMDKLTDINFFGTTEENANKKMYFIEKTGKYTYRDWLEGEKIKGEFLALVKKRVFKKDMFDEEIFCFEGFFWNKVIKKYGLSAFDIALRRYSFQQESRESKKLLDPDKSLKRYEDYKSYLNTFEKDYTKFKLNKQLSNLLFITGFYASMGGKTSEGRKYFSMAIKKHKTLKNILAWLLSFTGKKAFMTLAKIKRQNA